MGACYDVLEMIRRNENLEKQHREKEEFELRLKMPRWNAK